MKMVVSEMDWSPISGAKPLQRWRQQLGLQHLIRIGADESEPMVQRAIQYALNTFDEEKMGWEIVPKEVETAPRAIWWNYGGDWPWGNPSAEMTGLLHHYKGLVPEDFLEELTAHAVAYINEEATNDHHELQCLVKLMKEFPAEEADKIRPRVREIAQQSVTTDPENGMTIACFPFKSCLLQRLFYMRTLKKSFL